MPVAPYIRPSDDRMTAERLARLPKALQDNFLASLTDAEKQKLNFQWPFWARDKQLSPDGNWVIWMVLAGRGFGKTRVGAEWVRQEIESGRRKRLALVARTAADVRDVMVEGESGILATSPPWFMPKWEATKRRLTWPNGAIATTYTGDEPAQLRGPQHDGAWCDEVAAWRYPEAWDQLQFGLRLGRNPQAVITTTPRPTKLIRELVKESKNGTGRVVVTTGSTRENAGNLAPTFLDTVVAKYEGTRLGLQELEARILDDNPLALWSRSLIDQSRVSKVEVPPLHRVAVALDPSANDGDPEDEDLKAEAGIVAGGIAYVGGKLHGYILEDASVFGSPAVWGRETVKTYNRLEADRVVAEANNGGAMVRGIIHAVNDRVPVSLVHASRGKVTRAEPVSALYEQGRVHHVGVFAQLEDQMVEWIPGEKSPDRMDALVWLVTALMGAETQPGKVSVHSYAS